MASLGYLCSPLTVFSCSFGLSISISNSLVFPASAWDGEKGLARRAAGELIICYVTEGKFMATIRKEIKSELSVYALVYENVIVADLCSWKRSVRRLIDNRLRRALGREQALEKFWNQLCVRSRPGSFESMCKGLKDIALSSPTIFFIKPRFREKFPVLLSWP